MNYKQQIADLEEVNEKLKIFQLELDEQLDDMLKKYKSLKVGFFAFLEIEQFNAKTLIEASEDHDVVKFKIANSNQLDNMSLIWDEYNKQLGKIELLALLEKEIETVFKVADTGESDESDLEAKLTHDE